MMHTVLDACWSSSVVSDHRLLHRAAEASCQGVAADLIVYGAYAHRMPVYDGNDYGILR